MKQIILKSAVFIFLIITNLSCSKTNNCENCVTTSTFENSRSDEDLALKFDIENTNFQPIHLDLKESYAVLASYNNESLKIRIKEFQDCKRISIDKIVPILCESESTPTHYLNVYISKDIPEDEQIKEVRIKQNLQLLDNQEIDVHIIFEGDRQERICNQGIVNDFGNGICRAKTGKKGNYPN